MDFDKVKTALNTVEDGLSKYIAIMDLLHKVDVSKDASFRRMFNGFYRVRQRRLEFYDEYFRFMEEMKTSNPTFDVVLFHFYNTFQNIEASFSSKLVATINPDLPVWDSIVLKNLGFRKPGYRHANRIEETIILYNRLCKWHQDFWETSEARHLVFLFDEKYPKTPISMIKKIDLILWKIR